MSGIQEMIQRQKEFEKSQPKGGAGNQLFLGQDDLAVVWFIGSGQSGDPYFEYYLAHDIAVPGRKFGDVVYCPTATGHSADDCVLCEKAARKKERMAMWFWVEKIYYARPREKETLPVETYYGRERYVRAVDRPLIWDTSAWRESPLRDIELILAQIADLRKTQFLLTATGAEKDRRYKLQPSLGNQTLLVPEKQAEAVKTCQPILEWLSERFSNERGDDDVSNLLGPGEATETAELPELKEITADGLLAGISDADRKRLLERLASEQAASSTNDRML